MSWIKNALRRATTEQQRARILDAWTSTSRADLENLSKIEINQVREQDGLRVGQEVTYVKQDGTSATGYIAHFITKKTTPERVFPAMINAENGAYESNRGLGLPLPA